MTVEQIGGKWPDENGLYLAENNPVYGPQYLTAAEMREYVAKQEAARASYLAGNTVEVILERAAQESREQERERERQAAQERAALELAKAQRAVALVQQKAQAWERFRLDAGENANMGLFETTWQQHLARLAIDDTSG